MQLKTYLDLLAECWAQTTGRTLVALGGVVVNDGKFIARMRAGSNPTTETFERFLAFFRDGSNWPDNVIPMAAADLLDRLENIAVEEGAASCMPSPTEHGSGGSTGQAGDVSREALSGLSRPQAEAA